MASRPWKTPKGTEVQIMDMRGKDYLEVKYRLVWFREEKPAFGIETETIAMTATSAVFKATIKDESGRVVAMAHKSEDKQGFPDFMEKAETGAIGRALALIGYGTQFCGDEFDEGERLADSPVDRGKGVRPEDPGQDNGTKTEKWPGVYRMPQGKWRSKSLMEVAQDPKLGPLAISSYVDWFEDNAKKSGKPVDGWAAEYIAEAERFLAAMENGANGK